MRPKKRQLRLMANRWREKAAETPLMTGDAGAALISCAEELERLVGAMAEKRVYHWDYGVCVRCETDAIVRTSE